MHINNEIGTMQPVEEIGQICAKKQAEDKAMSCCTSEYSDAIPCNTFLMIYDQFFNR